MSKDSVTMKLEDFLFERPDNLSPELIAKLKAIGLWDDYLELGSSSGMSKFSVLAALANSGLASNMPRSGDDPVWFTAQSSVTQIAATYMNRNWSLSGLAGNVTATDALQSEGREPREGVGVESERCWEEIKPAEPEPNKYGRYGYRKLEVIRTRLMEEFGAAYSKSLEDNPHLRRYIKEIAGSWDKMLENAVAEFKDEIIIINRCCSIDYHWRQLCNYWDYLQKEINELQINAGHHRERKLQDTKNNQEKRIINRPDTRSWFFVPMGVEYTFHIKIRENKDLLKFGESERIENELVNFISKRMREMKSCLALPNDYCRAYLDSHMLEACSPIHKNWNSMVGWYRWLRKELGNSVYFVNNKMASGGGHINPAIPKYMGVEFLCNLFCDIGNRPYLGWVFNDPGDNSSANCMWRSKQVRVLNRIVIKNKRLWGTPEFDKIIKDYMISSKIGLLTDDNTINPFRFDGRGYSVRVKSKYHFEFRIFDAPRSERDLFDMVSFTNAYMRWVYEKTVSGEVLVRKSFSMRRMVSVTRRDFYLLLDELGLERKNYRRFLERNFDVRRSKPYGRRFLK